MAVYYLGHPNTRYFEGDCAAFAVALAEMTGAPLAALVEHDVRMNAIVLVHAFVLLDDGNILDAAGVGDVQAVVDEFFHDGSPYVQRYDAEALLRLAYGAGGSPRIAGLEAAVEEVVRECKEDGYFAPDHRAGLEGQGKPSESRSFTL